MNTLIDLFLLTIIVCYIEDCSGFIQSVKRQFLRKVMKIKNPNITSLNWKPWDCSRCLSFYSGLIYLLFTHNFIIPYIAFVSFLSLISSNISGFLFCVKDILTLIENLIQRLIQKFTL
jgi:hypothetical protein